MRICLAGLGAGKCAFTARSRQGNRPLWAVLGSPPPPAPFARPTTRGTAVTVIREDREYFSENRKLFG